jgi:hypothetical protein
LSPYLRDIFEPLKIVVLVQPALHCIFRQYRHHLAYNVLDRRVSLLLCLPLESLDKLAIQKEIDRIGKAMPELKAHA